MAGGRISGLSRLSGVRVGVLAAATAASLAACTVQSSGSKSAGRTAKRAPKAGDTCSPTSPPTPSLAAEITSLPAAGAKKVNPAKPFVIKVAHGTLTGVAMNIYWSTKISIDGIYLHELDSTVYEQDHGSDVSHGCLNLDEKNASWYFRHSMDGDPVVIHGKKSAPTLQVWQGGDWTVPWATWIKGGVAV